MPEGEWPESSGEAPENLSELLEALDLRPLDLSLDSSGTFVPAAAPRPASHKPRPQARPSTLEVDPELPIALQQLQITEQLIAQAEEEPSAPPKPPQAFKPGFLGGRRPQAAKQPAKSQGTAGAQANSHAPATQQPRASPTGPVPAAQSDPAAPSQAEPASQAAELETADHAMYTPMTAFEQAEAHAVGQVTAGTPPEVTTAAELLQASSADLSNALPMTSPDSAVALDAQPLPELQAAAELPPEPDKDAQALSEQAESEPAADPSTGALPDVQTLQQALQASSAEPSATTADETLGQPDTPPASHHRTGAPPEVETAGELLRAISADPDGQATTSTFQQEEAASVATFAALQPVCRGLMQAQLGASEAGQLLARLQQLLSSCPAEGLHACLSYTLMPLMYLVDSAAAARSGMHLRLISKCFLNSRMLQADAQVPRHTPAPTSNSTTMCRSQPAALALFSQSSCGASSCSYLPLTAPAICFSWHESHTSWASHILVSLEHTYQHRSCDGPSA